MNDVHNLSFQSDGVSEVCQINPKKSTSSQDSFILYKKRFIMNFLLSISLFLNGEYFISYSSITKNLCLYFGKSENYVNWFGNVFLVIPGIVAIFFGITPNIIGIRNTLIITAVLHSAGSFLRFIPFVFSSMGKDIQFIICMVGSIFMSIPQATWFGAKERDLSTSIPSISNMFGIAVGYLMSFSVMRKYSESNDELKAMIILIITLLLAEDKPKTPPSRSEEQGRQLEKKFSYKTKFLSSTRETLSLLKKWKVFVMVIIFGILYANMSFISTFLAEMFDFYQIDHYNIAGYIGATVVTVSGIGVLVFGFIVTKLGSKYHNIILCYANFACGICIFVILILKIKGKHLHFIIIIFYILLGFHFDAYFPLGSELIADISYPVESNIGANCGIIFGNLFGGILIPLFGVSTNSAKYIACMVFAGVTYIISGAAMLFLNFNYTRCEIDNN